MGIDRLKEIKNDYDVIVIGSGLGGLTAANYLAKEGKSVLLLEHHYQYGGLATWFRRKHKHIFDISLHGFPYAMVKSCRRYWNEAIASKIAPLPGLRFMNPEFTLETTYQEADCRRILTEIFGASKNSVDGFFDSLLTLKTQKNNPLTTHALFNSFFPERTDIHRFLLEPIAYANGSSLEDPAFTFAMVFINFMKRGIYVFEGGTDTLIGMMLAEAEHNGVTAKKLCLVEKISVENTVSGPRAVGVVVNGREIRAKAVISNANLKTTLFELVGKEHFPPAFSQAGEAIRLNHSSCQVYFGIAEGESIPHIGDLIFYSEAKDFSSDQLLGFKTTSRTFSVYYPRMRPHNPTERFSIVASLNARYADWSQLSEAEYLAHKERLCEESLSALEKIVPDIRSKLNWIEAATPRTVERYTKHQAGASFGTKFEGLAVSEQLPQALPGLFHAGSVGIIMSGWLGTINYGLLVANKVDQFLENAQ